MFSNITTAASPSLSSAITTAASCISWDAAIQIGGHPVVQTTLFALLASYVTTKMWATENADIEIGGHALVDTHTDESAQINPPPQPAKKPVAHTLGKPFQTALDQATRNSRLSGKTPESGWRGMNVLLMESYAASDAKTKPFVHEVTCGQASRSLLELLQSGNENSITQASSFLAALAVDRDQIDKWRQAAPERKSEITETLKNHLYLYSPPTQVVEANTAVPEPESAVAGQRAPAPIIDTIKPLAKTAPCFGSSPNLMGLTPS